MRIEFEIGFYNEHLETALKWFGWIKEPTKKDIETQKLFEILLNDFKRQDKEDETD